MAEEPSQRFTHFDAAIWTAGVTFVSLIGWTLAHGQADHVDMVKLVAVQLVVYLSACALFAWRRPGHGFAELFAMRDTSRWLLALGLLLGPAMFGPAETLSRVVEHLAPETPEATREALEVLMPQGHLQGALLFVMLAVGGPLVEELLFRGAIFSALRPVFGLGSAVWTTALCFTLTHPRPRVWLPVFLLALALSWVRAHSGSLWPGFLAHAGFNAVNLAALWLLGAQSAEVPVPLEVAGWVLTALVLAMMLRIARESDKAHAARALDEVVYSTPERDS